jgi:hypothetical protein
MHRFRIRTPVFAMLSACAFTGYFSIVTRERLT